MILDLNMFVVLDFYVDTGLSDNTVMGYDIQECTNLVLFSWDGGNKFLYTNDNIIKLYSNTSDFSNVKIILYGLWTFPQGNIIQAKQGNMALYGVSKFIYFNDVDTVKSSGDKINLK